MGGQDNFSKPLHLFQSFPPTSICPPRLQVTRPLIPRPTSMARHGIKHRRHRRHLTNDHQGNGFNIVSPVTINSVRQSTPPPLRTHNLVATSQRQIRVRRFSMLHGTPFNERISFSIVSRRTRGRMINVSTTSGTTKGLLRTIQGRRMITQLRRQISLLHVRSDPMNPTFKTDRTTN